MTLNYLKPFEPGDPIDINVLNKLIQNVNFLASQIAQIYKLPAIQAPVTLTSGATGSTSGNNGFSGNTDGSGNNENFNATDVVRIDILANKVSFRNVGQTIYRTITKEQVESVTGKTIKGFKILTAGYSNAMFVPKGKTESNKKTANGAKLRTFSIVGSQFSFVPAKDGTETYKAGENAPQTTGSSPWYWLYVDFSLSVEVTY